LLTLARTGTKRSTHRGRETWRISGRRQVFVSAVGRGVVTRIRGRRGHPNIPGMLAPLTRLGRGPLLPGGRLVLRSHDGLYFQRLQAKFSALLTCRPRLLDDAQKREERACVVGRLRPRRFFDSSRSVFVARILQAFPPVCGVIDAVRCSKRERSKRGLPMRNAKSRSKGSKRETGRRGCCFGRVERLRRVRRLPTNG